MKAVLIDAYGGPEKLRIGECEKPVPGEGEILIRVAAVGVNPADGKWRAGMFASMVPLSFPHITGYDVAGTVEAGGDLAPGTRVVALLPALRQGGYAEWAAAPIEGVAPIPDAMGFATAAAIPTPGLTGAQLIEEQLDVQPGHRVLVTGVTGAVGRFALVAAKARGAIVIAAVRTSQREDACALGADFVLTLGGEDWEGPPFDRIADTVGGTQVAALCRHIAPNGVIRTASTTPIPSEGLPVKPSAFAVHADPDRLAALVAAVAAGKIAVPIVHILPLDEARRAHCLLEAGGLGGKIILLP
jgi:NADPH:quinone reductase-like Zn-dependent oxidoreductase